MLVETTAEKQIIYCCGADHVHEYKLMSCLKILQCI